MVSVLRMRTMTIIRNLGFGAVLAIASSVAFDGSLALAAALGAQHQSGSGDEVPNFALIDHHGRLYELRRVGGKAVVLFFTANDCPVARQSASKLKALREKYGERGVSIFLVNSSLADSRKYIS